jgi:hypothetical protein
VDFSSIPCILVIDVNAIPPRLQATVAGRMSGWASRSGVATHFDVCSLTGVDSGMKSVRDEFLLSLFWNDLSVRYLPLDILSRQAPVSSWTYARYATNCLSYYQLFASLPPTSAGVVEEVFILEFLKVVDG